MPNQSMGRGISVGCDSFRDETYGDVKMSGDNVWERNIRSRKVRGRIVPVPYQQITNRGSEAFMLTFSHCKVSWLPMDQTMYLCTVPVS
jgi:hypothetical protein